MKMIKKSEIITLIYNSEQNTELSNIDDLIPVHYSSMNEDRPEGELNFEQFERAVALIWNAIMGGSENLSGHSSQGTLKKWEPKPVSDA